MIFFLPSLCRQGSKVDIIFFPSPVVSNFDFPCLLFCIVVHFLWGQFPNKLI